MDALGKLELKILGSLKNWTEIVKEIENLPKHVLAGGSAHIPPLNIEEVGRVSVGAIAISGGLAGMASGATTSAVMALGTASTGTAISSLSGAVAINAVLDALGGGSLAAGSGGMALDVAVLGGATLGVGLLVGGIIMGVTGDKLSAKADEAWSEMRKNEEKMKPIKKYFDELASVAKEQELANKLLTCFGLSEDFKEKISKYLNQMRDIYIELNELIFA